jgi:hypothetical protein
LSLEEIDQTKIIMMLKKKAITPEIRITSYEILLGEMAVF